MCERGSKRLIVDTTRSRPNSGGKMRLASFAHADRFVGTTSNLQGANFTFSRNIGGK
jgi:hypothetical protein